MSLYIEVSVPRGRVVRFPHACVSCLGPPTRTFRVGTNAIGWWTALLLFGARHVVEVPACAACHRRMTRQRLLRLIVNAAVICAGVAVALRVLGDAHGLRRWVATGIALVVCMPWIAWQAFRPPPFDITAYSDHVEYEFASREYARRFTDLNDGPLR